MHPEQHLFPEEQRSIIIDQNLAKMRPGGEMDRALGKNPIKDEHPFTARERNFSCYLINGSYDEQTGEIKIFAHAEDTPPEIQENYPRFRYRITEPVQNARQNGVLRIIVSGDTHNPKTGRSGKIENPQVIGEDILKEASEKYNIQQAQSFEDLDFILEAMGRLRSSLEVFFTAEQLKSKIERLRGGDPRLTPEHITRRGGLRDKVVELLGNK